MAGHRRARAVAEGKPLAPRVSQARRERIEHRMHTRYAEAENGLQRLAVMCDYVRAAASAASRVDSVRTDDTLTDLALRLNRAGDALLRIGGA